MAQLSKVFFPYDPLPAQDLNDIVGFMNGVAGGTNLEDEAVTPPKLAQSAKPNYQTDNNNSIANVIGGDIKVQMGWGQALGNGTATFSDTVTLPQDFSTILGVSVAFLGTSNTSPAATIVDLSGTLASSSTGYNITASSISNSSFNAAFNRSSGTFSSSVYWGYSWIAWGIV